jgi:hypothetical protein
VTSIATGVIFKNLTHLMILDTKRQTHIV